MRKRERLLWVLLLAVIPLAVTPAFAGKTAPVSRPLAGSARAVITGSAVGSSPQCSLGITGPAISSVGYIIPGEDQYYTLIDPSECEGG